MNDDKPEENTQSGQQNPPAEEPADNQTDWQARFEAQRKVNRDLERKLNDAYKRADRSDELEREIAELEGKQAEWQQSKERERFQNEAIAQANMRVLKPTCAPPRPAVSLTRPTRCATSTCPT